MEPPFTSGVSIKRTGRTVIRYARGKEYITRQLDSIIILTLIERRWAAEEEP